MPAALVLGLVALLAGCGGDRTPSLDALRQLRDQACACRDRACAETASDAAARLLRGVSDRDLDDARLAVAAEAAACVTRLGVD